MDVRLRGRVGQAVVVVAANGGSGGGSRVVESGVRGGSGGRRGRLLVGAEELALGGLHLGGVLGLVALAEANGKEDWKNDLKGLQYFWLKAGCTYLLHLLRDTFSYKALHLGNTRRRCTTTAPESVHRSEHLSALAEARVRRRRLYIRCIGGGVGTGEVDITNERARARARAASKELSVVPSVAGPLARSRSLSVSAVSMIAHLFGRSSSASASC